MLSVLVPILRRDGELDLANAEAAPLIAMTASTIDRRIAGVRAKMMPRGRSHTKPGSLLKSQIPIGQRDVQGRPASTLRVGVRGAVHGQLPLGREPAT